MAAEHFNCVHITLDNLVAESDSKSANKVLQVLLNWNLILFTGTDINYKQAIYFVSDAGCD